MSKFIEVEITREQAAVLYIEVADDFDLTKLHRFYGRSVLSKAARETLYNGDWDSDDWESTIAVNSAKFVEQAEAEQFKVFDATKGTA